MYTKNDMSVHESSCLENTEELELNGADNIPHQRGNMEEKIISKKKLKLGKQLWCNKKCMKIYTRLQL